MPRTSEEITADSQKLKKLMPSYADTPQVFASAKYAERHDDKKALNKDRRIGAHLLRLETLLSRDGVESRAWDSAVKQLTIDQDNIPETFWKQQVQLLRDQGQGDIHLTRLDKDTITGQLQDAQLTGLKSWRDYLEQTGDQYPLWFKLYAWEGMSGLGVFDQQRQRFHKRSKDTVAPYPQLNPAVLAQVYDMVTKTEKTEPFNVLYSRILIEQKALMPTPENPEDVHGEWREYTADDIESITHAAQATPWCIAGEHYAKSYTQHGGKFLLFHLQDQETGVFSSTACASVRLNGQGEVVELSGLKGGSRQYIEDGLIPAVEEKVKTLPGGEHYLQAFEDKQKLIIMDRKFQAGEPFTTDELLFLYEANRRIQYIDTYAHDPRPEQFKRHKKAHLDHLTDIYGNRANAKLLINPIQDDFYAKDYIKLAVKEGVDPDFLLDHLSHTVQLKNLDLLADLDVNVDVNELSAYLPKETILSYFDRLHEHGLTMTIEELAEQFNDTEKLRYFRKFQDAGLTLTADELANTFDEPSRLGLAVHLKRIGATFDTDELIRNVYGNAPDNVYKGSGPSNWLKAGASPSFILKIIKLNRYNETRDMHDGFGMRELNEIVQAVPASGIDQAAFIDQLTQKLTDNKAAYLATGGISFDYLGFGFDVDVVAKKKGVDAGSKTKNGRVGGTMLKFMELGVSKDALLDGLTKRGDSIDTYDVSQNIEELTDYGCDIEDIVSHIVPKYQFDKFDELQAHGARLDINDVVGKMEAEDILYKIRKIQERGVVVNVNEVSKRLTGTIREHRINELITAGADPRLIGEKISIHNLVGPDGRMAYYSEHGTYERYKKEFPEVYERVDERISEEAKRKRADYDEIWRRRNEQARLEQESLERE